MITIEVAVENKLIFGGVRIAEKKRENIFNLNTVFIHDQSQWTLAESCHT